MEWNGMDCNGLQWTATDCNGMQRNATERRPDLEHDDVEDEEDAVADAEAEARLPCAAELLRRDLADLGREARQHVVLAAARAHGADVEHRLVRDRARLRVRAAAARVGVRVHQLQRSDVAHRHT